MPREAGSRIAVMPAARLPQSYGYLFDNEQVRTAYRCRAYPDYTQQQQQALGHQHRAFTAFFARRARYPRFKSRRTVRTTCPCSRMVSVPSAPG